MLNKITSKIQYSETVFGLEIEAPLIAESRKPGQFLILSIGDTYSERIPLTIADANIEKGTIKIIFQAIGKTTKELAGLNIGDEIAHVAGPLGHPTHIENFGKVICVAGGIGCAPLLPIAKALVDAGNELYTIIGARSKDLILLEDEFQSISKELIITTDDGSYGRKALVTEPLEELCQSLDGLGMVVAIGPTIMMKFCCKTTEKYNIPTTVSLNTIMVDGTGMCGGCRVDIAGETKFVCVDGPEFDGHKVDFDMMLKRMNAYKKQESESIQNQTKNHKCRLDNIEQ